MRPRLAPAFALAAAVLVAAPTVQGQYFGRNKVQYESFDFRILRTEHFDIYFYPAEREAAVLAGRMAERWYSRLSRLLNHELDRRQPLILYANHPHFEQTNALQGELGEGTGGVTEVFKRRMVLPFGASLQESDHVIGHELVHAFQYDITGQGRSVQTGGIPGALTLPLWFIEGMAEYLTNGPIDPHTATWLRDAATDELPSVADLSDPYDWFPYRWGQILWAWIGGSFGDEVVARMLEVAGRARDPEAAIAAVVGLTPVELTERWHRAIRFQVDTIRAVTDAVTAFGRDAFPESDAVYHVGPALSPDGTRLAFISERDLFSIDIFVADVATGGTISKVTQTAVDPHFESLQFISSAGSFTPDGRQLAVAAVVQGQPVIALLDVETGRQVREVRLPELGEIYTPAVSPDGRTIAFAALHGGFTDLFLYDLETEVLRPLTDDVFADVQPAWSPDGRHLAWATDRWTTTLEHLAFGPLRIGVYDVGTRRSAPLGGLPGKQINPQWGPDGAIYFVSSAEGVNDLYRARIGAAPGGGTVERLTTLYTGISGITPTSPALSVAARAGTVAFNVYRGGAHRLIVTHVDSLVPQGPVPYATLAPAALPPRERLASAVPAMLADQVTGLPDPASFATDDYSASLGLDYVAQPSLVIAADQFNTFIGGGAALYWSDMLGDHSLATILQVNGSYKDITALVGYTNLSNRWNWGVVVSQVPQLYQYYNYRQGELDGVPVIVEEVLRLRQTNRAVTGQVQYPFNRVARLELAGGYRNIDFDQEVELRFFDPFIPQQVGDSTVSLLAPSALHLATTSAALVYDNALNGATSPIIGQRWRVEATSILGSLNFATALADYRRYVVPVRPFTLAGRILHYGRYGPGANDDRLAPLFLGSPSLVRGYDNNSFTQQDCVAFLNDPCPTFSQLLGTRLLVGNAEFRFPLLGALGVGAGYYGFLPVEFAIFGDAGVAWSADEPATPNDERAFFLGGDRDLVTSAGAAMRVNFFGFVIVEVDYAYAFQRHRWIWQFSFQPGF